MVTWLSEKIRALLLAVGIMVSAVVLDLWGTIAIFPIAREAYLSNSVSSELFALFLIGFPQGIAFVAVNFALKILKEDVLGRKKHFKLSEPNVWVECAHCNGKMRYLDVKRCLFCRKSFCDEHLSPEKHNCEKYRSGGLSRD